MKIISTSKRYSVTKWTYIHDKYSATQATLSWSLQWKRNIIADLISSAFIDTWPVIVRCVMSPYGFHIVDYFAFHLVRSSGLHTAFSASCAQMCDSYMMIITCDSYCRRKWKSSGFHKILNWNEDEYHLLFVSWLHVAKLWNVML